MNVLKAILARLSEPSTYAGLAALAVAVGQITGADLAAPVAQTVTQAGAAVAADPSPSGVIAAGVGAVLGLFAIFRKEKGGP
jgi:hypothetical protein